MLDNIAAFSIGNSSINHLDSADKPYVRYFPNDIDRYLEDIFVALGTAYLKHDKAHCVEACNAALIDAIRRVNGSSKPLTERTLYNQLNKLEEREYLLVVRKKGQYPKLFFTQKSIDEWNKWRDNTAYERERKSLPIFKHTNNIINNNKIEKQIEREKQKPQYESELCETIQKKLETNNSARARALEKMDNRKSWNEKDFATMKKIFNVWRTFGHNDWFWNWIWKKEICDFLGVPKPVTKKFVPKYQPKQAPKPQPQPKPAAPPAPMIAQPQLGFDELKITHNRGGLGDILNRVAKMAANL